MTCYLVRHGKDNDTVRGGWSSHGLTPFGVEQIHALGQNLTAEKINVGCIYSSDLQRAKETSAILSDYLNAPIVFDAGFREVNNGDLAGMNNDLAKERYPGLYWSSLAYSECYPNGESPELFFRRIQSAWSSFKKAVQMHSPKDVLLVSHGGVIEAILCIENGTAFSNTHKQFPVPCATAIPIKICESTSTQRSLER